ncbi:MAG TPA: methyltransferase domain-containing protein [Polyangiaceae bacterium]|nr:methyltransferase domain-containing protein [Polyangiaceae bacterium]
MVKTIRVGALVAMAIASGCASAQPAPKTSAEAPAAPTAPAASADDAAIHAAVSAAHRSEQNRARDVWRHPEQTLSFFGLRSDMTVLELWPGTGWYTEILAPMLAQRGKLIVTSVDPDGPQDKPAFRFARQLKERFEKSPELFGKVQTARIDPPEHLDFGPEGSVDLVLTFRSVHDWVRDGYADKVFAAMFKVLKPGGVLGVVAHRGGPDADPAVVGKTGYLSEAYVIGLAQKAGFTLAARSDVNANPKDDHNHPEGVWTLPPTLRLGDKDKDKYVAVGESDRMTLRFTKPAAK